MMKLGSIKSRQYVIILLIILLLSVGALNIYFYTIVESSEHQLTRIISLEKFFSDILVKEIHAFKAPAEYEKLVNSYSALRRNFYDILTDTEDEYLADRLDYSEKYFNVYRQAIYLNNSVKKSFNGLINSIRYIHEHHIVYLKNLMRHGSVETDFYGDENFHRSSDRSASEIDIIQIAASMQTSLLDIVSIFDEADQNPNSVGIKAKFSRRMEKLNHQINTFESYSLDAQDGILVEELLMTSRQLAASFSGLLEIEESKALYLNCLDAKKDKIVQAFEQKNKQLVQANRRLKQTIETLQFISLVVALLVASAIIMFGKKIKDEAVKTVDEARKIQDDISYQIQVDEALSLEFRIIFNALNTMTCKINSYIQQLQESEKKYRLLVENQTDMIVKFDEAGDLLFVSPSVCKTFNRTSQELMGSPFIGLFDDHGRQQFLDAIKKVTVPPHNSFVEIFAETIDGGRYQAWLNTALLDAEGRLDSVIGVGRDIHAQKLAEGAIRRLSRAIEASPASVVITDPNGTIEYVNPKFVEVTGFSSEETLGNNPRILNSGTQPSEMYDTLWETISSGREWRGEFCNRKKNGEIYWESAAIAPVSDETGKITHYVAVKEDITDRRKYEKTLEKARKSAEAAAQAKSLFLANMSHEIRTPLNAVLGFIDLSLEDASLPDLHREYLGIAQNSAKSLLGIINDILDISKLESGKVTLEKRPFDLRRLLEQIRESMNIIIQEKQLDLLLDLDPSVSGLFVGDDSRLRQVVVNLLNNAIKFTDKGHVLIRVKPAEEEKDGFHFMVEDTGIGIPGERLGAIFEPFTQADQTMTRRFGGTGLGTAICRELVELMGGRIWVASEEGTGTWFHFILPLTSVDKKTQLPAPAQASVRSNTVTKRSFNVLLVEDVPINIQLAQTRLESQKHHVTVAWNGRQAIDAHKKEDVDIILMDIQMPEMCGIEATKLIRSAESGSGCHIPIIAMTASVTQEETTGYQDVGIDAVVPKPVDFVYLEELMETLVPANAGRKLDESPQVTFVAVDSELSSMEGIDIEKAMAAWQEKQVYEEALLSFLDKYRNTAAELVQLLEKGDVNNARQVTHALKGVAANLFIGDVAEIAGRIEKRLRQNRLDDARGLLPDLKKTLETVIMSIERIKPQQAPSEPIEKEFDRASVKKLFYETLSAFEQFSPYAVEPILSQLGDHIGKHRLVSIAKPMNEFNFDEAKRQTLKLAQRLDLNLED